MAEKPTKKKGASEMEVLFPNRKITLSNGRNVIMAPIALEDLSSVMDTFSAVLSLQFQGFTPLQILVVGVDKLVELLRKCIIAPKVITLTAADAPYLMNAFCDMNMDDFVLGEWRTLGTRLGKAFPELVDRAKAIQNDLSQNVLNSSSAKDISGETSSDTP